MAHVKGHIIKKANQSTALNKYQNSGGFFHYRFRVTDFEKQKSRFLETDSYEPERFEMEIVILSKANYDRSYLAMGPELDIILLPQTIFNYASNWSLDGRSNWVVFDPAVQISH